MLLMGDEVRRTQHGNNNAYCQDNETSWLDWTLVERHRDIHRFAKELIALRQSRDLPSERFDMTLNELLRRHPVQWNGVRLNSPDWSHESHTLGATLHIAADKILLHLMVNAYWEALAFDIPAVSSTNGHWRRCIDTFRESPDDISGWADAETVQGSRYTVQPRSVVLLSAIL